uniref:Uncharacterized protein n=1 Tax=Strongyloides stercoralis TaxID=6248 RepID=A0AAF5I001_STRER
MSFEPEKSSLMEKLYHSKLFEEINKSHQFIELFAKDYSDNGFQEEKFIKFGERFMSKNEIDNQFLIYHQIPFLSYKIMKDSMCIGGYVHQLATLVFKKSFCIVFNLNWTIKNDDNSITKRIKSVFPGCDFDFFTLNMRGIHLEYYDLKKKARKTRKYDNKPTPPKSNTESNVNIEREESGSSSLDCQILEEKSDDDEINIQEFSLNENESWCDSFWKSKRNLLLKNLMKHFNFTVQQKEKLSSVFATYLKYLVKKKLEELVNIKETEKTVNNYVYKMAIFMANKDSGKLLLKKILNGEISGKKLLEYKLGDFCEKKTSFATKEIIYNSELLNKPALQTFPCKKCATMHSKYDSCRRDD